MLQANQIQPNTPVVGSNNGQFAIVDHMEGADAIKLKKDAAGQHHYIPMAWVKTVDTKVHVDRTGEQAMREWSTSPPTQGIAPSAMPAQAEKNHAVATTASDASPPRAINIRGANPFGAKGGPKAKPETPGGGKGDAARAKPRAR